MNSDLIQILGNNKQKLFVGIGNVLKRDDGVGVYICSRIYPDPNIQSLCAETGIERFIGKINQIAPEQLILIDCMDFGENPGTWKLIRAHDILDQFTNTHHISLKRISEFFKMDVIILGIQPADIRFGEGLSKTVKHAASDIIALINHKKQKQASKDKISQTDERAGCSF